MLVEKLINVVSDLSIADEARRGVLCICEELKQEFNRLRVMCETDPLGDWPNRQGLFRQSERIFSEYERGIFESVSVAFVDLDNFKLVNDTYGHKHGDEIIVKVADIIQASIRKIDAYGRLCGDEFVVILPGSTKRNAEEILKRIKKKLRSTIFSFNTEKLPISLSYGIVSTEAVVHKTFEQLLHEADRLMTTQKEGGRGR